MKLKFYAITKDYFGDSITIEKNLISIQDLKQELITQNPEAEQVVNNCRFAVDMNFVDEYFLLQPNFEINVIPPSSGG
ncbi:MAG: MoaD/ThiS family protein [Cytophagales bacterium]